MDFYNINSATMKKNNLQIVLDTIRRKEPISRKELAGLIGLTSSSITNIVNRLISEGYLVETGSGESCGGRKPIMLELNSNVRYIIGVEMNVLYMTCIITDFRANKIAQKTCDTLVYEPQERVIDRLVSLIEQTIKDAGIPREKIIGIGLVSAGPYDHESGIMINPPNFPGWYNVPIKSIVEKATSIVTYFEKETVGAAIAEYWLGAASSTKSLFAVNVYDIGIGGGVIIDGKVYHGFCDGAGDLGHMAIDIEGPICSCGNRGCLETMASGMAIVRSVKAEIKNGERSILMNYVDNVEDIGIEMVIDASNKGDNLARRNIEKGAKYLGAAIANIINVYSPEMVVIGGPIPQKCPLYFEVATQYIRNRVYPLYNKDVKISSFTFGDDQGAMGGVALVLQEFYKSFEIN